MYVRFQIKLLFGLRERAASDEHILEYTFNASNSLVQIHISEVRERKKSFIT